MYEYAFIVAILWSIYPFFLKDLKHNDPIVIWSILLTFAALISIIICVVSGKKIIFRDREIFNIISASSIGFILAPLLYVYLLTKLKETSVVIALAFSSPLFAVLIGYYICNENMDLQKVCGIGLIIIGIIVLLYRQKT